MKTDSCEKDTGAPALSPGGRLGIIRKKLRFNLRRYSHCYDYVIAVMRLSGNNEDSKLVFILKEMHNLYS
jgi:hypothetical protein